MRRFIEDAERRNGKERDLGEGSQDSELEVMEKDSTMQRNARQEAIDALKLLFEDFQANIHRQHEADEGDSSDSLEEFCAEPNTEEPLLNSTTILPLQEDEDTVTLTKEPQLYLCDDWIQPVEVVRKPVELCAREKAKARIAKKIASLSLS